ncbi:MAG: rhomboid family intramembrane serine protease [Bryobacteraceae bacterium]
MFPQPQRDETPLSITAPPPAVVHPALEFRARLETITPQVFVAKIIVALNVVVYLAMVIKGVHPLEPTIDSLLQWGADFGPRTITGGEWWRLLTSMFLHIGIIHLAFNMFVLWQIGPFVERLLGNAGFVIVYLVSGLAGSLVSVAWHPYLVSAGASGAIFGLYGALLGFMAIRRDSIPTEVLSPLTRNALIFVGYNVVYGFMRTGTDVAAHMGGLAGGFICGLCLSVPLTLDPLPRRGARNAALALGSMVLFVGAAAKLPRPIDFRADLKAFADVERKAVSAYNADLRLAHTQHLGDEKLADMIEKDVLPGWVAEHDKLARLKGLPDATQRVVSVLVEYMDERRQAWSLLVNALRQHDFNGVRQAMQKQHEAEQLVKTKLPASH